MLKRTGCEHDPAGIWATKEGECGIICPVYPHLGINLPSDGRDAPPDVLWVTCCSSPLQKLSVTRSWIYRLFLCIDANMWVVRKKVSSKDANPTLSPGWSYFVENTKYKEHLAQYKDQKETVSCCFIIWYVIWIGSMWCSEINMRQISCYHRCKRAVWEFGSIGLGHYQLQKA